MKKLFLVSLLLLSSTIYLQAQGLQIEGTSEEAPKSSEEGAQIQATNTEGPQISFDTTEYNFGKINTGDKITHIFEFENKGTEPLLLLGVRTSCGCTAPSWPKEPVMPGKKGEVKIIFDSTGKSGSQNKKITVSSNANNNSSFELYLRGEVEKKNKK